MFISDCIFDNKYKIKEIVKLILSRETTIKGKEWIIYELLDFCNTISERKNNIRISDQFLKKLLGEESRFNGFFIETRLYVVMNGSKNLA